MYDIDWESDEAYRALKAVSTQKYPVTEFEMAEIIMTAKESYWYSIASNSEHDGAKALVELVDSGYNVKTKNWWDVKATWSSSEVVAQKLTDITLYLATKQKKNTSLAEGSFMWPLITQFILGKHSAVLLLFAIISPEAIKEKWLSIATGEAFIKSCVNPECDKLVDRRKRKSGACCRNHMRFECHHPDCIEKAAKNGWERYCHPFNTKIAARHWEFRATPAPDQEGGQR